MAKKAKESLPKEITLAEFKAWLQGVEDMQPDNWAPSKEQWTRIREKIDLIFESEAPVAPSAGRVGVPARSPVVPMPSRLEPTREFVPFVPEAVVAPTQMPNSMNLNTSIGGKAVTPNIDTSNGSYDSSFA